MKISDEILACEFEYIKCFSKYSENEDVIRFHDDELPDMYYHNYTQFKRSISGIALNHAIDNEISIRMIEQETFCNIILHFFVNGSQLSKMKRNPEISNNGYYSFDISQYSKLQARSDCLIQRVFNQEMVDDVLFCDLQHDEEKLGRDFCRRRCYRRGKVYITDKGVNSYVCYHNGAVIGTCDLFTSNGVAKIEDFAVIPPYQRKGYGTTILKALIDIALKENSHTIYLVTDEDDTAKEMYQKIGFNKVGERTDLFFLL